VLADGEQSGPFADLMILAERDRLVLDSDKVHAHVYYTRQEALFLIRRARAAICIGRVVLLLRY